MGFIDNLLADNISLGDSTGLATLIGRAGDCGGFGFAF